MYHGGVESVNESGTAERSPEARPRRIQRGKPPGSFDRGSEGIFGDPLNRSMGRERVGVKIAGFEQRRLSLRTSKCRSQAGGSRPSRDKAASDAGMGEERVGAGDQRVTGEGEIETAAGARPVDGGDRRCGVVLEPLDDAPTTPGVGCAGFGVEDGDLCKMGAGKKDARVGRAEYQGTASTLRGQRFEGRIELVEDPLRKDGR